MLLILYEISIISSSFFFSPLNFTFRIPFTSWMSLELFLVYIFKIFNVSIAITSSFVKKNISLPFACVIIPSTFSLFFKTTVASLPINSSQESGISLVGGWKVYEIKVKWLGYLVIQMFCAFNGKSEMVDCVLKQALYI